MFQNGHFEVQDTNSQRVGFFCKVETGMRVVDACAGAGGKTLHLSELMEGTGQIIALDIYDWKLKELKRRAKRNGLQNIQTRVVTDTKVVKRMKETADLVLIDSPCSGLGVLKRNPNTKWRMNWEKIQNIQKQQAEILDSYSRIVKKGGAMIYVTCSILPSENELQVAAFLERNKEFKKIEEQHLFPSETNFDGFYMARLEKIKA